MCIGHCQHFIKLILEADIIWSYFISLLQTILQIKAQYICAIGCCHKTNVTYEDGPSTLKKAELNTT